MPERFFQPFQRSRCLFTPDTWCGLYNDRSPSGPFDFLCNVQPQTVLAVLPPSEQGEDQVWDRVYKEIAAVWEDRQVGFQCFRAGAEAFTLEQPCDDCGMIRHAHIVIIDLNGGEMRAASFRELAVASAEVLQVVKMQAGGAPELPSKKVILINNGDPQLPPHFRTIFDIIDYSGPDGQADLDELRRQLNMLARAGDVFHHESETIVIGHKDLAVEVPARSSVGQRNSFSRSSGLTDSRNETESSPDASLPKAEESVLEIVRVIEDELLNEQSTDEEPSPPDRMVRDFVERLGNVSVLRERLVYDIRNQAKAAMAQNEFTKALQDLDEAGPFPDQDWESSRRALAADCLEKMLPAEVISFFFQSISKRFQERLNLSSWSEGLQAIAVARLSLTDIYLREQLGASDVPVYLAESLCSEEIELLYRILIKKGEGDHAAILISVKEGDQMGVGLAIADCRDREPPIDFIVLRLADVKRTIRDKENGLKYFKKCITEHLDAATDFYAVGIQDVVFEEGQFFGRKELVGQLVRRLRSKDSFAIVGLRRSGKTSLVRRLMMEVSRVKEHLIVLIELERVAPRNLAELYYQIAMDVRRAVESKYSNQFNFDELELFNLPANEQHERFRHVFVRDLEQLMASLREDVAFAFQKLVLIFDEFETLLRDKQKDFAGLDGCRDFLRQIRALNRVQGFMFGMVVYGPPLRDELSSYDSPLFDQVALLPLGMLTSEECNELVETVGKKMSVYYDSESLDMIFRLSGGDPLWTKYLCSAILAERQSPKNVPVKPDDVERGWDRLLRNEERQPRMYRMFRNFEEYYRDEASLLRSLAREYSPEQWVKIDDLERCCYPGENLKSAIDLLLDYSLLDRRDESRYRIRLGLLHRWLQDEVSR